MRGISIYTEIFSDVELNVLPTAISWIGQDGGSDVCLHLSEACHSWQKKKARGNRGKWKVEFRLSCMFFRSLVGAKPVTKKIEDNANFNCCIFDDADEKIKSCFTTADNYAAPKYTNYSYKDLV